MPLCSLLSALGSVPAWLEQHAVDSLTGCLSDCLSRPESEQHPIVVDIISSCLDGFALGASAADDSFKLTHKMTRITHTHLYRPVAQL